MDYVDSESEEHQNRSSRSKTRGYVVVVVIVIRTSAVHTVSVQSWDKYTDGMKLDNDPSGRKWLDTVKRPGSWKQLSLNDELLVHKCHLPGGSMPLKQSVMPDPLCEEILHQLNDLCVTGHLCIQ